jgi:LysM domain
MMRFSVPRLASCQPLALVWALAAVQVAQAAPPTYPVTEGQRGKAQQVATAGVALSELAPDAPESYTVKRGDTLWDISKLFLRNAWRWPELWGMNLEEIRNPHLIYPGQMLYLDKSSGRARLRMGKPVGMAGGPVKLSPRVRDLADNGAIPAVPMEVIEPFLNEAVILDADELERSPRLVAAPEGRALMSRGDLAYVRGPSGQQRDWRVFRGYEAVYVGTAEQLRVGSETKDDKGQADIVPATFRVTSTRLEAGVGDRFAPVPSRDFSVYGPHAPANAVAGKVVSVYGEAVNAGQNQIVTLNMGSKDGMERGHVLALWTEGRELIDKTDPEKARIRLPDERHGLLYVFRVFNRMSYALILTVQQPVRVGDRFTQP